MELLATNSFIFVAMISIWCKIYPTMKLKFLSIVTGIAIAILSLTVWLKKPNALKLRPAPFGVLSGWQQADLVPSFVTFKRSCKTFMRQDPDSQAGSHRIPLRVKDWQPACQAALAMREVNNQTAHAFFEKWFTPVEFYNNRPVRGLFTGYYMPLLHGSLTKTKAFNVPIYGLPSNLVTVNLGDFNPRYRHSHVIGKLNGRQLVPYPTRKQINEGAIKDKAHVLVWVNSAIDRLFLEIQGSGVVQLTDGRKLYLGYAGENGAPYTPVGRILVEKGIMTKKTASMQGIRAYLEAHPDEIDRVINQNKSFVFFRILKQTAAQGAQGIALTPGYSLAVDRQWIPLGAPLWLNTTHPDKTHQDKKVLKRLMIAQDTGGAIRGVVRGDVFWGAGEAATHIAGKMKNKGQYWLLLPHHTIKHLPKTFS